LTLKLRVRTRTIVPLTRPASEFQLTRSWILKLFGTVVRSDAAEELQESSSRTEPLSGMSIPTAASPIGSAKIVAFCRQLALLILESRA
jgi:hypothetical protein